MVREFSRPSAMDADSFQRMSVASPTSCESTPFADGSFSPRPSARVLSLDGLAQMRVNRALEDMRIRAKRLATVDDYPTDPAVVHFSNDVTGDESTATTPSTRGLSTPPFAPLGCRHHSDALPHRPLRAGALSPMQRNLSCPSPLSLDDDTSTDSSFNVRARPRSGWGTTDGPFLTYAARNALLSRTKSTYCASPPTFSNDQADQECAMDLIALAAAR